MTTRDEHRISPGLWPEDFPVLADGTVEEGLVVLSQSGSIEGRTTGARLRCSSIGCEGWFIGVSWETGQRFRPCSQGWRYDPITRTVRITGGGDISARVVSPPRLGSPPKSPRDWPKRQDLAKGKGWRVGGLEPHRLHSAVTADIAALDAHAPADVLAAFAAIQAIALKQRWAYRAESVRVHALPSWLVTWLSGRDADTREFLTLPQRWHSRAPESWRLALRVDWDTGTATERSSVREDGWIHPDLPPALWPQLTERIWRRTTVTDAAGELLAALSN